MAKLILLLAIACFQLSQQGKLPVTEKFEDEDLSAVKATLNSELTSGKDHSFKEEDDKDDEEWTEEDEKWLQEIQSLLEGSDEDYDDDSKETMDLILEIESWIEKTYPEKNMLKWLLEIKQFFDDLKEDDWDLEFSHYSDYIKKEKNIKISVNEKDRLDLYYSWLYQMYLNDDENEKVQTTKRFSSV